MTDFDKKLYRAVLHTGVAAFLATSAIASVPSAALAQAVDQAQEQEEDAEEIVITGSRIRRDAFSSTTPLQVLDAGEANRLGITSVSELLQRSTAASGQQIDATLNTNAGNSNATEAPPTGGIGSSNISLRNLGPERTLVLVNGRRFGTAGVRGAPSQPDINLIPFGMVETVDILTGGLSTIYGADAVAGVVNVRLKEDFDGVELSGDIELTEDGGGNQYRTSVVTGVSNDRGNITLGFEYAQRERVSTGQRDFSRCLRTIATDTDGNRFDPCRSGFFDNVLVVGNDLVPGVFPADFDDDGNQIAPGTVVPGTGPDGIQSIADAIFFYRTPGTSDIGIPGFSTGFALPQPTDPQVNDFPNAGDPRAILRFPFNDFYNDQDERRRADLIRPQERFSIVANGHYDLDWGGNEQLYFEAYYFNRTNNVIAATEQIFPDVPGFIPQEENVLNGDGEIVGRRIVVDANGDPVLVQNPQNPFGVSIAPIVTLDDLPQNFDVEVQQFRGVLGFKGDFHSGWLAEKGWNYDTFFSYDRGTGFQAQEVLLEPNVVLATNTLRLDPDGNLTCGIPLTANDNGFLTPEDCVPVNFLADSIFDDGEGRFSTQEERDFLIGTRTNRTVTKQYNAGAFFSGEILDIPTGGPLATAFGFEWRKDEIISQNDITGTRGFNAAENPLQEGDTIGSRWIYDIYGEISIPLLEGHKYAETLQIDGAVRYTEEENFGSEVTWRLAGLYAPVDYLRISGSYNTSFRAPNLREQFLADQGGGIGGGNDPCLANNIAALDGDDPDTQRLIDNCTLSGADVSVLGTQGVTTIPIRVGGADNLVAEESRTYTGTIALNQPWFDSFDLDIALTYFDIEITDTVEELDAATILSRCFNGPANLESPFCDRISRPQSGNPASRIVNFVDASFVNVGVQTSRGLDLTTRFQTSFDDVLGKTLDLTWTTGTTYAIEQERQVFSDSPVIDRVGRIGSPEWLVQSTVSLLWDRYELLWQGRYIGQTEFEQDEVDPDNEPSATSQLNTAAEVFVDQLAERKFYNDITLTGNFDIFALTFGINNVLNAKPALVSGGVSPNRNNAVSSAGYDFFGRTYFLSGKVKF